jgi:ElaB/YqjD/DUF883 family membrane-anchored ribosome-binding protein
MNKLKREAEEVLNRSEQVCDRVKDNVTQACDSLKPKTEELLSKVKDKVTDFYQTNKEMFGKAEDYVEESLHSVNDTIRKQPLSSILIAAGIGYLFSKLTNK